MNPQRKPRRRKPPRRGAKAKPETPAAPAAPVVSAGAGGTVPPGRKVKVPAGGGRRPPSAGTRPKPKLAGGGGGGVSFVTVMLFVLALVIAGFMIKVMMPRDLSDIKGFPKARWEDDERNLLAEAQQVLFDREKPLTLSESEVNAYLRDRIKGKQGGPFAAIVKYQGTYVDFENGSAEVLVVRTVMGMNFAISTRIVYKDLGNGRPEPRVEAGSIGGLALSGEKQFEPVGKAFQRIKTVFEEDLKVISAMGKVTFEKDTVILNPVF